MIFTRRELLALIPLCLAIGALWGIAGYYLGIHWLPLSISSALACAVFLTAYAYNRERG